MKRKLLTRINLLLGSISLTLAGCSTQKNAPAQRAEIKAMYGVMIEEYRPVETPDSLRNDSVRPIPTDSQQLDMPRRDPQIMVKYGVRIPRENQQDI